MAFCNFSLKLVCQQGAVLLIELYGSSFHQLNKLEQQFQDFNQNKNTDKTGKIIKVFCKILLTKAC
jgi:hypothetical protein